MFIYRIISIQVIRDYSEVYKLSILRTLKRGIFGVKSMKPYLVINIQFLRHLFQAEKMKNRCIFHYGIHII